jgi:hypothetical protein
MVEGQTVRLKVVEEAMVEKFPPGTKQADIQNGKVKPFEIVKTKGKEKYIEVNRAEAVRHGLIKE